MLLAAASTTVHTGCLSGFHIFPTGLSAVYVQGLYCLGWSVCCNVLYCAMQVRVSESQVKNRLYIGNLPRGMTQHQVEEVLKQELLGEHKTHAVLACSTHMPCCGRLGSHSPTSARQPVQCALSFSFSCGCRTCMCSQPPSCVKSSNCSTPVFGRYCRLAAPVALLLPRCLRAATVGIYHRRLCERAVYGCTHGRWVQLHCQCQVAYVFRSILMTVSSASNYTCQ